MTKSSERPKTTYRNVVIRFTRQTAYAAEDVFQLTVRQSPAPLPGGAFQLDIETQLQEFREIFAQYVRMGQFFARFEITEETDQGSHALVDLGDRLYQLLPAAFRQAFPRLLQDILERGDGVRISLEARAGDKADGLLGLPWEILFLKQTRSFPARSPRVLIVRRLLDAIRQSSLSLRPPFDVLHVVAHSDAAPERYAIDAGLRRVEQTSISQAVKAEHYHQVPLPVSINRTVDALQGSAPHIVHFLGHGEIQTGKGSPLERGYLRFVDDDGTSQWVTGEQFQHWLAYAPTVQMVVLNACHGGTNVARSVTSELVYHGLPYVVAIQGDILQDAARYFIEAFYTILEEGRTVEYAVAAGRAAIAARLPQTLDWCLPVLYTSVGLASRSVPREGAERLWLWFSETRAQQRIGLGNLILGGAHLITGLLLWISNLTLEVPTLPAMRWTIALVVALSLIFTLVFYNNIRTLIPEGWHRTSRWALILRILGTSSLVLGLSTIYGWFVWSLSVGLGFWTLLTPLAQHLLFGLIAATSLLGGSYLSYSQLIGHVRALLSDADIEVPAFTWQDLSLIIGGYLMSLMPWLVSRLYPQLLASPGLNLIVGSLLLILGTLIQADSQSR